jgi:hypothetical protein
MRPKSFFLASVLFSFWYCKAKSEGDAVVREGKVLIQTTAAYYSESRHELAHAVQNNQPFDLLKLVKGNTQATIYLYDGIKHMARKYPEASRNYAENPNLLGRQLGPELRPLFAIVNKLAAEIKMAMKSHPDREKVLVEYQELMLAWVKVLAVFGTELKQG